jgi:hypothetical protein
VLGLAGRAWTAFFSLCKNRARQAAPYESESKLSHSKFLIEVGLP